MLNQEADRYVSFCNIACDENADKLIAMLDKNIATKQGNERWIQYFGYKREEQKRMNHDNLHFIGNQINTLYEYFKNCDDTVAIELLYQLEQECC